MKSPVKFKIIDCQTEAQEPFLERELPLGWSDKYLSNRPGILTDVDIFCENIRSENQEFKDFTLFKMADERDSDVVYVYSIYLEIFEFLGRHELITKAVKYFSEKYPNNLIVFQWNHDNNYARYGKFIEKYSNVRVINFGYTSKKFFNSITVPFWNINTTKYSEPKKTWAAFYGTPNNRLRQILASNILNHPSEGFEFAQKIPQEEFYQHLSQTIFSLCPKGGPGGGGFSYRFFECMHLNTVPVIMVDNLVFPYEEELDWNKLCIKLPETMVGNISAMQKELKARESKVEEMLEYIDQHRHKFSLLGVQQEVYKAIQKYHAETAPSEYKGSEVRE